MSYDPVIRDLSRHLDQESLAEAREDAIERKATELREEWSMELWQDSGDRQWGWNIVDAEGNDLANEWCKTEDEAWVGLREGMDRASRRVATAWLKDQ